MLCSTGGADQMLNKRTDGQIMDVECVEGRVRVNLMVVMMSATPLLQWKARTVATACTSNFKTARCRK